jgi:hypothetical protein
MIPDLRIKGQPVSLDEVAAAPSLSRSSFVVLPDETHFGGHNPLETRDKMVAHLRESGETYEAARHHADRAAQTHDRRSR